MTNQESPGDTRWVDEADALSWVPELAPESVALAIADPPYSINTKSDGKRKLNPWADMCNAAVFYAQWLDSLRPALRQDGAAWVCSSWRTLVTMQRASCLLNWPIEDCLVWDKKHIGPGGTRGLRPRYELVLLFARPDFQIPNRSIPDITQIPRPTGKGGTGHPAEKPRALAHFLLDASALDGLVVDPFAGSGSFWPQRRNADTRSRAASWIRTGARWPTRRSGRRIRYRDRSLHRWDLPMSNEIRILGIDPGFASTGVACLVRDENGAIRVESVRVLSTKKASKKQRVALRVSADDLRRSRALWDGMHELAEGVHAVAYEVYTPFAAVVARRAAARPRSRAAWPRDSASRSVSR